MAADSVEKVESEDCPIFNHSSLQEFTQSILKKVVLATQQGNSLCSLLEEYEYWLSFPLFHEFCKDNGSRILQDIGELLRHHAVQCGWVSGAARGISSIDIEERFERLVDANDIILENVGSLIDEASGIKKNETPLVPISMNQSSPMVSSWNRKQNSSNKQSSFKLLLAKNIQRPQLEWIDKINNTNTPFIPYLKTKPNALKPLSDGDFSEELETDPVESLIRNARSGNEHTRQIKHPYEYEISEFEPSNELLERKDAQLYWPIDDKPVNMVETEEQFTKMFDHLALAEEIAIDLEHHSYRSFQGFVCLMQISTRTEDFIVDTLKLRDELHVLNEVFTNPRKLKVLHGADMDIGWLMRDFGLYIVNMFDTGQAARTLTEERFSLAYLLKKHCNVDAQKQYQLADWRIRPLPKEMMRYAREDTHYLLYVYDCMRNTLIDRGNEMNNLLRSVYSKSASICLTLYEKPRLYPHSHTLAYQKYRGRLDQQQMECFRLLYDWRDKISREEDESLGYTLPNHMMYHIAENLPREAAGVIACCNPVPPLVKQNIMDVHRLVLLAREFDPLQANTADTNLNSSQGVKKSSNGDMEYENSTYLDDSKSGFELYQVTGPPIKRRTPTLTVFEQMEHLEVAKGKKKVHELLSMLSSPFQRYLPNTGLPAKHPEKINRSWTQSSKEALSNKTSTEKQDTISKESMESEKKVESLSQKRKSQPTKEEEEVTLRDMLPGKKKKKQENTTKSTEPSSTLQEFMPFDYSQTDMKKFSGKNPNNNKKKKGNMNRTEEPRKGKAIKTKVRDKTSRSMTYK